MSAAGSIGGAGSLGGATSSLGSSLGSASSLGPTASLTGYSSLLPHPAASAFPSSVTPGASGSSVLGAAPMPAAGTTTLRYESVTIGTEDPLQQSQAAAAVAAVAQQTPKLDPVSQAVYDNVMGE